MEIQKLQGHRWFIWAIVFLVVSGVALTTYVYYSSSTADENAPASLLVHHPKPAPVTANSH